MKRGLNLGLGKKYAVGAWNMLSYQKARELSETTRGVSKTLRSDLEEVLTTKDRTD